MNRINHVQMFTAIEQQTLALHRYKVCLHEVRYLRKVTLVRLS